MAEVQEGPSHDGSAECTCLHMIYDLSRLPHQVASFLIHLHSYKDYDYDYHKNESQSSAKLEDLVEHFFPVRALAKAHQLAAPFTSTTGSGN